MTRDGLVACLLVLLWLPGSACSRRQEAPGWAQLAPGLSGEATIDGKPAPVRRFSSPPLIDGKLDDPVWADAALLGPFVEPGRGNDPGGHPVAAVARIGWDGDHLYLAVVVRDRAPGSPFSAGDVDPHVWSRASGVEMVLQPGDPGDNRDYYEIQVDVAGAVFDSHFDDYNQPVAGAGDARVYGHQDWSSRIERAVHVGAGFYSVEMALPFAALAPGRAAIPPRAGDVWRMNLYSFRDGQSQALAWSPLRGQGNFHRAARFGRIGFE